MSLLICWGLAGPNCSAARQYCALIGESRVKLGLCNGTCCGFLVEGCRERPLCEPLMFLGRVSGSADSFTHEELETHFTICTRDCNSFTLNPEERNAHTHTMPQCGKTSARTNTRRVYSPWSSIFHTLKINSLRVNLGNVWRCRARIPSRLWELQIAPPLSKAFSLSIYLV